MRPAPLWSPIPDALAHSWGQLSALIAATAERQEVPCIAGTVLPTSAWTSEDPDELELAAQACAPCPVKHFCLSYGIAHPREAGIYGGRGPKQRKADSQLRKGKKS